MNNFYPRSPCGERRGHRWIECRHPLFLSTLSLRRATYGRINDISRLIFLSTLSLRRATHVLPVPRPPQINFYPRSPCGERPAAKNRRTRSNRISIHALLAESDVNEVPYQRKIDQFLSTLSLRRATSDLLMVTVALDDFYPRSPCGERRRRSVKLFRQNYISIHALLAESDNTIFLTIYRERHFYPRSPCGERRIKPVFGEVFTGDFYPRSPCGERQAVVDNIIFVPGFLSTLSLRRATRRHRSDDRGPVYFYPRSPCGERRNADCSYRSGRPISIHALLAESDGGSGAGSWPRAIFLSTLSLRRATG